MIIYLLTIICIMLLHDLIIIILWSHLFYIIVSIVVINFHIRLVRNDFILTNDLLLVDILPVLFFTFRYQLFFFLPWIIIFLGNNLYTFFSLCCYYLFLQKRMSGTQWNELFLPKLYERNRVERCISPVSRRSLVEINSLRKPEERKVTSILL